MSATATKKTSGIREAAKKTGSKVKNSVKNYRGDIIKSYEAGYKRGWDDAYHIPNRLGAKSAAAYGYKKGLTNRKKADKYTAQYKG